MRRFLQSRIFRLMRAATLCLLIFIAAWSAFVAAPPQRFDVQDRSFHFTFCAATTATNRTVFSGNAMLGRLNRKLMGNRIHRISRDQMYTIVATGNQPVLSIGYRHDNDTLKLDTNGYSYPGTIHLLDAVVVQPGGQTFRLKDFSSGGYMPTTKEYVNSWVLPGGMTNLVGCALRLSRKDDGKYVATCRLQ